jgi:hypothetical protein
VRNSLISAARDTAAAFVHHDAAGNLPKALGELRRYDWPLFKRLELDLLRQFPHAGREEITRVLPSVIDVEPPTHHEAALLLKAVFGQLPEAVQEDLLHRIDIGPPEEDVRKWLGTEATPENIAGFMTHWRARRYQLIANQLPPAWQERAREVMARAGTVRPLDQVNEGATWLGPTSPKTADDMAHLGPDEVLAFLRDWQPDPRPMESTPEGLGRVLQEVIAKDPAPYVNRAAEFRTVDPTFARFFFSGLESASKEHPGFDWQQVLDLAQWVVTQPRTIPGRQKALMEADPDWGWTRGTIANLLETGMRSKTAIGIARRTHVWDILAPLTGDPEPTLDYEERYGGSNMEPSTLAINTVRGKALNAVVAYALWVRRDLDKQNPVPAMNFDAMPEVRAVLDEHLDVGREPTLTIRSIYGRHFPWLFSPLAMPRIGLQRGRPTSPSAARTPASCRCCAKSITARSHGSRTRLRSQDAPTGEDRLLTTSSRSTGPAQSPLMIRSSRRSSPMPQTRYARTRSATLAGHLPTLRRSPLRFRSG